MDPIRRSLTPRPVPRRWLDEHASDASSLDRLLADRDLVDRLAAAGYTGPDWDYVARELIKYGYAVLVSWMRSGIIWQRLKQKGIGGLPAPPQWLWTDETWNDLAGQTLVVAIEKFRDTVLATGRWNPDGGASLKTFFIGQCLFRFPNPYRSWHTSVTAREHELPADFTAWERADSIARSPEQTVIQHEEISVGLGNLDDRTRQVLLMQDAGFNQTEIATEMDITRKSVEMIVRRHRGRVAPPPPHPTQGRRHGEAS